MTTEASLKEIAKRVSKTKTARNGSIAFHLTGAEGGDYFLDRSETGEHRLNTGRPKDQPLIEFIGDSKKILAALEGSKDARLLFLAGGFRVRGDLRYASDLGLELGILKEPL